MIDVTESGPEDAIIAFLGASPSRIDAIRGEFYCGPAGETLKHLYLKELNIDRKDALLLNLVPTLLLDDRGKAREPNDDEIEDYTPWLYETLKNYNPKYVVALGRVARDALGELADTWLPHPLAVRLHGDTGEVARKLRRIRRWLSSDHEEGRERRNEFFEEWIEEANAQEESTTVVYSPWVVQDGNDTITASNTDDWIKWQTSTTTTPANADDTTITTNILKADGEKRIVYGIVMEPNILDAHADYTSTTEIEQAAHVYLTNSRTVGDQHRTKADADVVESYIAPQQLVIGEQRVAAGSWVMGVKVHDEELWNGVKAGTYTGFSIGGFAHRA
jgi:uracil-DNA glycosylase family 4